MARFVSGGRVGRIREIRPTGRPECPYAAFFNGALVGHYDTEDLAYEAIQESLRAHLAEGERIRLIDKMRRGK